MRRRRERSAVGSSASAGRVARGGGARAWGARGGGGGGEVKSARRNMGHTAAAALLVCWSYLVVVLEKRAFGSICLDTCIQGAGFSSVFSSDLFSLFCVLVFWSLIFVLFLYLSLFAPHTLACLIGSLGKDVELVSRSCSVVFIMSLRSSVQSVLVRKIASDKTALLSTVCLSLMGFVFLTPRLLLVSYIIYKMRLCRAHVAIMSCCGRACSDVVESLPTAKFFSGRLAGIFFFLYFLQGRVPRRIGTRTDTTASRVLCCSVGG